MNDVLSLLAPLRQLHEQIREAVVAACEQASTEEMAQIAHESEGDTIFAIDRVSEDLLIEFFEHKIAPVTPIVLIAEGLPDGGQVVLPRGTPEEEAKWRIIVDPIDGTREIMYQKRGAWILTGVAPNRGSDTHLQDIELAIQTEIPTIKQHLSDVLWAVRGQGVKAERFNRLTGESSPFTPAPSNAWTIAQGFAMLARFYPGVREELAAIDEEIIMGALGPVQPGKTHCFEDQYLSTAGQLYELMVGHYRFVADLRPLMEVVLAQRGLTLGICCHPYDICTELIARELGVIVTDAKGGVIQAPLNIYANIAWAGYANSHLRAQIEPLLQAALRRRNLLD
jgi:fructose-1,6-bisphosphatase/inositol monophosphatase family enzyme